MPYEFVAGRHAVLSILRNPRRQPSKIFWQRDLPQSEIIREIKSEAEKRQVESKELTRFTLEKRFSQSGRNHQGVVLISDPYPYAELEEVLPDRLSKQRQPFYLLLDHIQDPHNLGALIRTAELAGCSAVIVPKDRACEITPTVVKTSAGACELLPVVRIVNINQTIDQLRDQFVTVVGLETGGAGLYELDFRGPLALVVGNENKGIAHLTQKKCDHLAEIPMLGRTASLNASVAGGIAMFEVVRQRSTAG